MVNSNDRILYPVSLNCVVRASHTAGLHLKSLDGGSIYATSSASATPVSLSSTHRNPLGRPICGLQDPTPGVLPSQP